jgi:hypothetical protein
VCMVVCDVSRTVHVDHEFWIKQHFHMPSRVQRGTALLEQAHEVVVAAGLEGRPLLAPAPARKRQRTGNEQDEAADTVADVYTSEPATCLGSNSRVPKRASSTSSLAKRALHGWPTWLSVILLICAVRTPLGATDSLQCWVPSLRFLCHETYSLQTNCISFLTIPSLVMA